MAHWTLSQFLRLSKQYVFILLPTLTHPLLSVKINLKGGVKMNQSNNQDKICPFSMSAEGKKYCDKNCQFYNFEINNCLIAQYLKIKIQNSN